MKPLTIKSSIILTLLMSLLLGNGTLANGSPYAKIFVNFNAFWDYYSYCIFLGRTYNSFDVKGAPINKGRFLDSLSTGRYVPVKIIGQTKSPDYKLLNIPNHADPDIKSTIVSIGKQYKAYFNMEGRRLPNFDFIDLNGKHYTTQNTRGKFW